MSITHADTLGAYSDNPATGVSKTDWNAGHVLTFVGAKAYATATQTVNQNVSTPVTFDAEEYDTDGFHSTSVNTSRFTIPAGLAGKYLICAGGKTPAGGDPYLDLIVNGATYVRGGRAGGPPGTTGGNVTAVADLSVGDYVEVHCFEQSLASISIGDGGGNRHVQMAMSIQYLGT